MNNIKKQVNYKSRNIILNSLILIDNKIIIIILLFSWDYIHFNKERYFCC